MFDIFEYIFEPIIPIFFIEHIIEIHIAIEPNFTFKFKVSIGYSEVLLALTTSAFGVDK